MSIEPPANNLLIVRTSKLIIIIYLFSFSFSFDDAAQTEKTYSKWRKEKTLLADLLRCFFFGYTWSLAIVSLLYIRVDTPIQRRRLCKETLRKINKVKMGTTRRMPLKTKERPTPIRIKHGIGLYIRCIHTIVCIHRTAVCTTKASTVYGDDRWLLLQSI